MKLITKQTDYAIRILGAMFWDTDNTYTAASLAEKLDISRPFARGILQKLNKENIVISTKGKGGGFKLSADLDKTPVIMIIKIFDGPIKLDKCMIRDKKCPEAGTCPLKKKLRQINSYINKEFENLTLGELLNQ